MNLEQILALTAAELDNLRSQALLFMPRLAIAGLLILAGLALAFVMRLVVRRVVSVVDRFLPGLGVRTSLRRAGLEQPAGDLVGTVLFWLVLLVFVSSALDNLGLPVLSMWVQGVVHYLPRVLSALLIGLAGVVVGAFLRDAITVATTRAGLTYGHMIGRLLQVAVLTISGLVAIDQIGLNVALVANFLAALLAATFLGAAIAFGLGARVIVANILACHYLRKSFQVGHRVRVGTHEGKIDQITPTSVVLEGESERIVIPARMFTEEVTHLVN
ncbi:MAG: mechanosensitive ion channel [Gemmatimonadetes bacterium]|jgi:small-conductance mechanosensitive channel|nr:mechanosensitive ion channel [Gemmatimonadota bacterium]